MEKMRLTLDDLQVQSFATHTGVPNAGGTVRAHCDTVADCPTGDANQATCVENGCVWGSCQQNTCEGSCDCLSAGCDNSGDCPTGGFCYGSFYASGSPC